MSGTGASGRAMWPIEARLLAYLQSRRGELVTTDEMVSAVYPNPDDEPEGSEMVMRAALSNLRRRFGVTVETCRYWRLPG